MSVPQTVQFRHKVTWTIKNFEMCPMHQQNLIRSPEFDVRCLDVTTWSFILHPDGLTERNNMQFAVRLHYSGSHDVSELHIIFVKYVIYIVDRDGTNCFTNVGFFTPSKAETTSSVMNFVPLEDYEDEWVLRNGALVVVCELTTKVNQVDFLSFVYSDDMISLISTLAEMLESGAHSDMIAYSKEKVPFDVHLCIMKARCPMLFSDPLDPVNPTPRGHVWYSSISTQALMALLFYIYGRMTIHVQNCNKAELMSVAVRYGLLDLERMLTKYPNDLAIATKMHVNDVSFDYELQDLRWEAGDETRPRETYVCDRNQGLNKSDLVVSFEVMPASEDAEAYIKIGLKLADLETGVSILINCTLSLLDDVGSELEEREHEHIFSNDEEWTPPPFLTRTSQQLYRPHLLRCYVEITEMSLEDRVSSNVCRVEPGRCVLFSNILLVGDDLLKLYMNHLNCDLKIKVQEFEFLGHKSFLEKRSQTIRKKVEDAERAVAEERSDMVEIRLNHVAYDICRMVMLYMYSGRIDIKDSDEAKRLGVAAGYFHLPLLLEKSFFFRSG